MQQSIAVLQKRRSAENRSSIPMAKTTTILRRSIHLFLQNHSSLTSTPTLIILPFSAAILLSFSSTFSLLATSMICAHLQSLFNAAGIPPSSQFFSLLNLKLSQTISTISLSLPFSLSFLLIAKASVIKNLSLSPSPPSLFSLYPSLLQTHLCNSFLLVAANATAFCLLFLAFNSLNALGLATPNGVLFLSAAGSIIYSIILANAFVVSRLAEIIAGMENSDGLLAILKACVLIRGKAQAALLLALPTNLGLAAVEALFQFRVAKTNGGGNEKYSSSVAWEAPLLIYMYSLLVLLDTVIGCEFYKYCKSESQWDREGVHFLIQFMEDDVMMVKA